MSNTDTTTQANTTTTTTTAPQPWHTGIDAEIIGHAQNKGWKIDDPKEAFMGAVKQARELEKHFGVPADQLIKLPKADAKPEEWTAVHQRLGAPADAKDYDLSGVKDAPLADTLRATAHTAGLSKQATAAIATAVQKHLDDAGTSDATVTAGKIAEERAALEKDWGTGAKFESNRIMAAEGARRLGISPEGIRALEGQVGYASVMEAMRKIGVSTREDTFVERGATGGIAQTREGAVARKAELMADKAWTARYLGGGSAEARELLALDMMIDGAN